MYKNVKKPFVDFKWRWASFTPSEGLNDPRVHLGVLRAMRAHEGQRPSSAPFLVALQQVEDDLSKYTPHTLNLVRANKRNLLRNSQQYWSGLGLLERTNPTISLTPFGRKVADGDITREEFAAATVRTLSLPNLLIESEKIVKQWVDATLSVNPLILILSIVVALGDREPTAAYLSNEELVRVVIPLSSINASLAEQIEHVELFRQGSPIFDTYEDFAPEANDKRMSREYLLFLAHHGFLSIRNPDDVNLVQKFFADGPSRRAIKILLELPSAIATPQQVADAVSQSSELSTTQRERRLVRVTARPGQTKFRREVLAKSGGQCLLTGETLSVVLRACHIIPVEMDGSDDVGNGLCLREDLHILFDSGHIRIDTDGQVHLSEHAARSPIYKEMIKKIELPAHVNKNCILHRWSYIS